jgi:CubicO group peptidase (beta-lactamase class C family)
MPPLGGAVLKNGLSRRAILLSVILAWQVAGPLPAASREPCGVPQAGGDWEVTSQAEAGIDAGRLCDLIDRIATPDANIHSVLIVRNGKLVFEHYHAGDDQKWGQSLPDAEQGPDIKHDVRSISKSVTSLLIGIALDRKLIPDLDRPVFSFFPEYAAVHTPAKDRILLRHLITMSSGIEWNENVPYTSARNSEIIMSSIMPKPYRYVLDQPLAAEPGTVWNYSGGGVALLGAVIQKVTGQRLEEFAREALFKPLGITEFEWATMANGEAAAASGLRLRSRDMAKLGLLVLSGGKWNGKSVVSAEWLRESLQPRFSTEYGHYGYLWWLESFTVANKTVDSAEALGLGGQRIIILPTLDMVIVTTTGRYGIPDGWKATVPLINEFILPAAVPQ